METEKTTRYPLGKRPPIRDRVSVPFGKFLTVLPEVPLCDLAPDLSYPMDGNDRVGCCVVAGYDHFNQVVTNCLLGKGSNLSQNEIWALYRTQNPGFDPSGTAATNGPGSAYDNGMNIQKFLEYLQGLGRILGFAKIDHTDEREMKAATYVGLSIITGVVLDSAQMEQFGSGVWDHVEGSYEEGGHCVPIVGYPGTPDNLTCVTWGKLLDCTQPFVEKQVDEAWFVLTQAHVDHPGFRNHFDLAGFSGAVSAITDGKITIPVKEPTLRFHSRGEFVKKAQSILGIVTDGSFGPITLASVEAFQAKHGLVPDGIVGPKTWAVLNSIPAHDSVIEPITVRITRGMGTAKEIIGTLTIDGNSFTCSTLERPWIGNEPNVSCIPAGTYRVVWSFQNDLNAWHYELQDVPGRSGIFIHNGNFYRDTEGCILLGIDPSDINHDGETDVTSSRATVEEFESLTNKQAFTLHIS